MTLPETLGQMDAKSWTWGVSSVGFLVAAISCFIAMIATLDARRHGDKRVAPALWLLLAGANLLMLLELQAEYRWEFVTEMRQWLRQTDSYEGRRSAQTVVLLIASVPITLAALWAVVLAARAGGAAAIAAAATLAGMGLFALECVSLHIIDKALHRPIGPVMLVGWVWLATAALTTYTAWRPSRTTAPAPGSIPGTVPGSVPKTLPGQGFPTTATNRSSPPATPPRTPRPDRTRPR